ncbi:signal peptide peptidase SppA [Candidatus Micrarchaeota archaeon]|nr:signal peptide peptidase SppA [Candidatus Micrarchaeota archaeon]MBI5177519.1 signal peptide peptidase SppA [Candidatus Micrarchaeota archaeon]
MEFRRLALLLATVLALGIVFLAFATADFNGFGRGLLPTSGAGCVGVVGVEGEITSSGVSSVLSAGEAPARDVVEQLRAAQADGAVGSILLHVNSPGGSGVASREIYDEVNASAKPVVAYFGEVAASGGYYVASPASYIVANPNAITGSIGVRATLLNYGGLFSKLGLREETIKTGEFKDVGTGGRNMTEGDRQLLSGLINETFANFINDVRAGRKGRLNEPLFAQALDARVMSARQAKAAGLIDEVGGRRAAVAIAAKLGNVTGTDENGMPKECSFERKGGLASLLSGLTSSFAKSLAYSLKQHDLGVKFG